MLRVTNKKGTLWVEGSLLNQRVRRSTRLPVGCEREAEAIRLKIERAIVDGESEGGWRKMTFGELAREYERWKEMEGRLSSDTKAKVARFVGLLGKRQLGDLRPEGLQKMAMDEFSGLKPGSIRRYLNVLSAVLNYGTETYRMPRLKVKKPYVDDARDQHLDEAQAMAFLSWVRDHEAWALPAFVILIDVGVRLGEAMQLSRASFDTVAGVVRVRRKKAAAQKTKDRDVPMTEDVRALVGGMPETGSVVRGKGGEEYASADVASALLGKVIKRGCKALGLQEMRLHDLRHTFAWLAANNGADVGDLQLLLGHKNIGQTMRYRGFVKSRAHKAVLGARSGRVVSGHDGTNLADLAGVEEKGNGDSGLVAA